MLRLPLGYRVNPSPASDLKDLVRRAATLGPRGLVLDAGGDLAPERLGETGRREVRHLLRSVELGLVALHLPTRRAFDTIDQLEDRLARADRAFALAFDLGTNLVLARVGGLPDAATDADRRTVLRTAVTELGLRAEHRGVRLAIETGSDPGDAVAAFLDEVKLPSVAASIDPAALRAMGHDPLATTLALGASVAHAYANQALGQRTEAGFLTLPGRGRIGGGFDWAGYLGALEEVDYRGYLTIWPDPAGDPVRQFRDLRTTLETF